MTIKLDDCDAHILNTYSLRVTTKGYVMAYNSVTREAVYLHRLIMSPPAGLDVDHIDGDKLDNRRANLRVCTRSENMRNIRRLKESKYGLPKGVYMTKSKTNPYEVKFKFNGITMRPGSYATVEEAEAVYTSLVKVFHGEFIFKEKGI